MKRIVILQPSYIPWLGYFDQIAQADVFLFFDDVQFTRRDWRNRNRIKLRSSQTSLLTVPVQTKGSFHALIRDIKIDYSLPWYHKHKQTLLHNYTTAPYFDEVFLLFSRVVDKKPVFLRDLNVELMVACAEYLGISSTFYFSSDYPVLYETPTLHLVNLCLEFAATHYLTGDSAADYLDEAVFEQKNIIVEYQGYRHPTYTQLWGPFVSHLSILDLMFNEGKNGGQIVQQNKDSALRLHNVTL